MAKKPEVPITITAADAIVEAVGRITGEDRMHTALEAVVQHEGGYTEHPAEPSMSAVLENASKAVQERQLTNANTATDHSNPDPRKNFFKSQTASTNMLDRLKAEEMIIIANVEDIDRRIAELQAERTDNMLAASGIRHAITAIEGGQE